jgi:hypothetical protein
MSLKSNGELVTSGTLVRSGQDRLRRHAPLLSKQCPIPDGTMPQERLGGKRSK